MLNSILKANQMQIFPKRSYHITTDSHHSFRKHKNIVAQLSIVRPEQVWVSDITYIGNRTNPMCLALVADAYSNVECHCDLCKEVIKEIQTKLLEQSIHNFVVHQRWNRDFQIRLNFHCTLDGKGCSFVSCPVSSCDSVVDVPVEH